MKIIQDKNKHMKHVENKFNANLEELLRRMYVDSDMSINSISKELSINYRTTWKWLKMSGIYSHKLNF